MTPSPRETERLVGHGAAEASLLDACRGGRLHHAWLVTGAAGIGKATLAYRFARFLLAGSPPGGSLHLPPEHPVFRRVAAGTHADLATVERAWDERRRRWRSEIVIDDVRASAEFLRLTAAEGGWRIVVLDGAEHLNRNAANALLKLLEEPPRRAMLLLTCAAPGRLPATLRSRCRHLRLDPLGDADVADVLETALPGIAAAERARLAALAEGSPGRAMMLADADGLAVAGLVDEVLGALPALPPGRAYDVADALGRSEGGVPLFMDLLGAAIAAAVRQGARGAADAGQARLLALRPLDAWCDVWHALVRLRDDTERFNLDTRQAVVSGLALLGGS